jgi:hypothetical protein
MTMDRRFFTPFIVVLTAAAASGCRDAPLAANVNSNMAPSAKAGPMQTLEYMGSPVTVKLEGSGSDPDGTIASYRWLSGTRAEGGNGRMGEDPQDVASPTVTLDRGEWIFTLWVTDNEGAVSLPSTVLIKVGMDITPEQMACFDFVPAMPGVPQDDCKLCLCGIDAMCRDATMICDKPCWDFYACVQNSCGDLLADMTALADCVRANCNAFYSGVAKYQMVKPCIEPDPCAAPCTASATSMGM